MSLLIVHEPRRLNVFFGVQHTALEEARRLLRLENCSVEAERGGFLGLGGLDYARQNGLLGNSYTELSCKGDCLPLSSRRLSRATAFIEKPANEIS